jgi:hypothetical protein
VSEASPNVQETLHRKVSSDFPKLRKPEILHNVQHDGVKKRNVLLSVSEASPNEQETLHRIVSSDFSSFETEDPSQRSG